MTDEDVFKDDGAINWEQAGMFELISDATNKVTHVRFRPTGELAEVDASYNITDAWEFNSNWSLEDAQACHKLSSIPLNKFFGEHGVAGWKAKVSGKEGKHIMEMYLYEATSKAETLAKMANAGMISADIAAFTTPCTLR